MRKNINSIIENIVRRTLNEIIESNLTLYHGTPYDFIKFQNKNIGSGEGNQSFGWGLYFTSNKGVAEFYANLLRKDTAYVYTVNIQNGNFFEWYEKLDDNFKKTFVKKMHENGYHEMPYKRKLEQGKINTLYLPVEQAVEYFPNGKFFYENIALLLGGDAKASDFLYNLGFDGIKYPVGSFFHGKSAISKVYNYVIFKSDNVQIVNKEEI